MTTTNTQTVSTLDDVLIKQLTWKPTPMRGIAVRIVRFFLDKDGPHYSDEITLNDVSEDDRNCIGSCWRNLANAGIIAGTGSFRRSKTGSAKGRKVFGYSLASRTLAVTFLQRNGAAYTQRQQEMTL